MLRLVAHRLTQLLIAIGALSGALSAGAATQADLDRLLGLISGDFDNVTQFEAQEGDTITHLVLLRRVVDAPAVGEHLVYAQINNNGDPTDVYRQTMMQFSLGADGVIRSRNLRFADREAHTDILADLDRFAAFTADDVVPALPAGCEHVWTVTEDEFVARIRKEDCVMVSRRDGKPRRIQATEFISAEGVRNEESGFREDGSMIFGLPEGVYYDYVRVSADACNEPVYMLVSGVTLDPARMGAYGAKIAETGIYAEVGGYYLNAPRPVAVFQGDVDSRHATLIVRFPCLGNARTFWYSKLYQETIKPLRENPSAGDYTVTVYREADLPPYMRGKVGEGTYSGGFTPESLEQLPEVAEKPR